MILCDSGPLISLIDKHDADHALCLSLLPQISGPFITTWPCLTEAMHIVGRRHGIAGQNSLWKLREDHSLVLHAHETEEITRMQQLMSKYHDVPMDLADASLVAAAESLQSSRIFTLDSDFQIYRLSDGSAFEIVPSP